MRIAIAVLSLTLGTAAAVCAQDTTPVQPPSQGPLVIERIETPFVVAPAYRVTEFAGKARQLVGGYAGWLVDGQLMIGGAVYTLVNGSHDLGLTYGGAMIGWSMPAESRVRFGGRTLVGVGTGSVPVTFARDVRFNSRPDPRTMSPSGMRFAAGPGAQVVNVTVEARDDFAVVEPEGNVVVRLGEHVGVDASVGYRWTGFNELLRDRVNGVTGALALQFGW